MAAKMTRCFCQTFSFGTFGPDGSAESFEDYGTDCNQSTTRVFAQGHDAKLVGFLVRAELAGEEIAIVDGGMRTTFPDAVHAAAKISEALAAKTQAQLDAAKARLAKAAAREATKAAKKSAKAAEAPKPADREATVKMGRWEYKAVIHPNGWATVTKRDGSVVEVASTNYKEV